MYQIDYRVAGYFYMLTAYDLESGDADGIREEIAAQEGCDPEDVEIMLDTLEEY